MASLDPGENFISFGSAMETNGASACNCSFVISGSIHALPKFSIPPPSLLNVVLMGRGDEVKKEAWNGECRYYFLTYEI
jgi:hypothetical protein